MENPEVVGDKEWTVPVQKQFFNDEDDLEKVLSDLFKDYDYNNTTKINLSGNSHSSTACQWIADNILANSPKLRVLVFSDMFTTRLKEIVPPALKLMLDSL